MSGYKDYYPAGQSNIADIPIEDEEVVGEKLTSEHLASCTGCAECTYKG